MNRDFLRKMLLFRSLEDQELVEILNICLTKKYPANQPIFAEGDPATKIYLIREGDVRISKMIPGVGEEALAILHPGDFFGEMTLIDEKQRSAYAFAHTKLTMMEIPIKEFSALLDRNKEMASKILWEFCRILSLRLRATNDKFYGLFAISRFSA